MKSPIFKYLSALFLLAIIAYACTREESREEKVDSLIMELKTDIRSDSLESYVRWMQDMGTRFCLADDRRDVAVAVMNKFVSLGVENVRLDSFILNRSYGGIEYELYEYNVIASIRGSKYPEELFILGGHYDSVVRSTAGDPFEAAPGANDNASGVAAALEVARVFSTNDYIPEYTIEFIAFGAEELGLWGSRAYAAKAKQANKEIVLMLNNDMIAHQDGSDRSGWTVNVMDYENSDRFGSYARMMAEKYTDLSPYRDNTYHQHSDSYAFTEQGYPALFFFIGSPDPYYHTPDDIADNCNFEYCKEVTAISLAILIDKTY
ncbi:MAG: M20/M25/M40 family metallo-hydrolase [Marinilabiliaceae bacterium]|jgi:hypothetical protein|nr:M20/M25/M40 family metallo-hydrolase [Marinilabiliaceae bacterium]